MDIRTAILKTADHVEHNPGEFNFWSLSIPQRPGCGTPGCALGWIATFMGRRDRKDGRLERTSRDFLRIAATTFYDRMDTLCGDDAWRRSASLCAATLRKYADKYYPAAPIQYPNWNAIATAQTAAPAGEVRS